MTVRPGGALGVEGYLRIGYANNPALLTERLTQHQGTCICICHPVHMLTSPRPRESSQPRRTLPPDLGDPITVARLSTEAVPLIDQIADAWGLSLDQRCGLMGGINPSTYTRRLKKPEAVRLSIDELTRASYLVGIYRALHTLYPDPLADDWMRVPNNNPLFTGQTPLAYATRGGIIALADIRTLLDGFRGGR